MYVDKEETDSTWIICRRYSGYDVGSVFLKVHRDFTKSCIVNVRQKIKYITAFCMMICIIVQLNTNVSANENNICYVAHRGYTKYAPENSIPAFEAVSREGFQAVECDIHETAKDKKGKRRFVIMYDQAVVTCKYKQQLTYMRKYAHKMPLEYVRHDFTQNDLSWMKKYALLKENML